MIGPEWEDLAKDADELFQHFRGKLTWGEALNAVIAAQILDMAIESVEPESRPEDDDWWKK